MRFLACLFLCLSAIGCSLRTPGETTFFEAPGHLFATWEGHRFRYQEMGCGERHIVFVHGFGASSYSWRGQIERFASLGYHVWAIDLIGFGESDKSPDLDVSFDFYRDQALAFMDQMGIQKAHLVGHSLGGGVSLAFAMKAPERLQTLTLIDPAAYPFDPPYYSLAKRFGKFLTPLLNRKIIYHALTTLYYNPALITEEQIDAYWQPLESHNARLFSLRTLPVFEPDSLLCQGKGYSNIRTPTLIVWGSNDHWIPIAHLESFKKDIPHAKQVVVNECGHAPQEEKPESVNAVLSEFFRSA